MEPRLNRARTPLLIAAVAALLYLPRLGSAPIYVSPDEVFISLHAESIARTGRDYGGRLLPLYVQYNYIVYDRVGNRIVRNGWLPPVIYYATALVLKVLPFSEATVRLPTAIVGIVDVLLMYFIGRRLFKNEPLAVLCAALLALTPAHFIHSRVALDYLYPVPFMLAWLLGLLTYMERGGEKRLFASTVSLGIGLYSYIASALVMPLYLVLTWAVLWRERRPPRSYAVATLGFLLPALLSVPWLIAHPTMLTDVLSKYDLNESSRLTVLQSMRSFFTYHHIGDQLSRYWAFFDPRFLFFDGPQELAYSTREVGVFLLPVAFLLVVGIVTALQSPIAAGTLIVIAGFLTAPLAATLVNVSDAIYRALELLPFVVLLSVYGVKRLWLAQSFKPPRPAFLAAGILILVVAGLYAARTMMTQSRIPGAAVPLLWIGAVTIVLGALSGRLRFGQIIAIGLLAFVPLQFAAFYLDYFTDYRRRTSLIFSGNIRGAFEEAMNEERAANTPAIYLARISPYNKGGIYWPFYLIKHGRQDLAARTINAEAFDPDQVLKLPAGSLVVTNAGEGPTDAEIDRLVAAGQLSKTPIREPDGTVSFFVLRRTGG